MMQELKSTIRILIADDHPLVLDGIASCLEDFDHIEVIGKAKTGREALEKSEELRPDIVLLDINMPEVNGLDATALFRERFPDIKLLILSMHDNHAAIQLQRPLHSWKVRNLRELKSSLLCRNHPRFLSKHPVNHTYRMGCTGRSQLIEI